MTRMTLSAWIICICLSITVFIRQSAAEPIFFEAENFKPSSAGWQITKSHLVRTASRLTTISGATGDPKSTASQPVTIKEKGSYRVWVRYLHHPRFRGPFRLDIFQGDVSHGGEAFDLEPKDVGRRFVQTWDHFDVELLPGDYTLRLSKHNQQPCTSYSRHIDCVLLTTDKELKPDHAPYRVQSFLRVTIADIYEKPAYVHIFSDHFRAPWYGHFSLSNGGTERRISPGKRDTYLNSGEATPWCNITSTLHEDSGAILNFSIRHSYYDVAPRMKARFEFATAPDDKSIVKSFDVDCQPGGMLIVVPPDLTTPEHLGRLKRDLEHAEASGRIADSFDWPTIGSKPKQFPYFVSARSNGATAQVDQAVADRAQKTLDYFGFSNRDKPYIHGRIWHMKDSSYCGPDIKKMREQTQRHYHKFLDEGGKVQDIVFCALMDEPTGQTSEFLTDDRACREAFRHWMKDLGLTAEDLLVEHWDDVQPVAKGERDQYPALHYYTQRFRTRALGTFMATQRKIIDAVYGGTFPFVSNFSDGATYYGNSYGQGVDYFELLDQMDEQNAIWGEDWANLASTYQCASYNVDLMRCAARRKGQTIGHYLIAHANRKPWDIKLKAASELGRGVKILENFSYGVSWAGHEGGPTWRSHTWDARPDTWRANAEIAREIGGVEEMLLPAMPKAAEVAILYSSSSDIWTLNRNHASGFNRMHTWLALAHAQTPVDFLSESHIEDGLLDEYKVCYFSGPNLTRAAAAKLKRWVLQGGVLYLTAGAGSRDQFNRPLRTLDSILPADRQDVEQLQSFLAGGRGLVHLQSRDTVTVGKTKMQVLSVKQSLAAHAGAEVLGTFGDGSPAIVRQPAGKGVVTVAGFLPALDYIKKALDARAKLEDQKKKKDAAYLADHPAPPVEFSSEELAAKGPPKNRLERSYNPWQYPTDVRELLLSPVRRAQVELPIQCSVPLIDAVYMVCEQGILIPLSNYTLEPIDRVALSIRADRPIDRVESIYHGSIPFKQADRRVTLSIPLGNTDYLKLYYQ